MKEGWILRNCSELENSIDENGFIINGHSMIFCNGEDDAMKEAERRAREYLTRQRFFLDSSDGKRASCFWIDV